MHLRQSTASQSVKLGPFVDDTDGVTAETGLSIANTDIKLSKAGGTMAAKNSGGGTHDADGWYTITLDATDTATVGTLQVSCKVAGAAPVFAEFQVIEEAVYDALYASGATGALPATLVQGGINTTAGTITTLDGLDTAQDTQHATTQASLATVDSNVDAVLVDTGTTLPASIATVDSNVDAILVDTGTTIPAILGTPAGADFAADIAAIKSDSAAILVDTGTTLPGSLSTIDTNVDAILVDTNELQSDWADGGRLDLILDARASQSSVDTVDSNVDAILVDTGTTLPASLATIDSNVDAILVDTGTTLPASLSTIDTNVDAILVDTGTTIPAQLDSMSGATFDTATDSLEALRNRGDAAWTTGAGGTPPQLLQSTTIATLASQTSFTLTAGSADDDAYNGAVVVVTDAVTSTQKAVGAVSDYTGSTKTVTLSSDPGIFTMAVGDSIDIIANASTAPSAAAVRAEIDANSTQLAAIVEDTGTTLPATLATIDSNVDAILVDSGTTLPALLATIDANVDLVLADTSELQTDWTSGGVLEVLLRLAASAVGAVAVTDNGATLTLSFKDTDGSTEVRNLTYTKATGERTQN